ncbi:putative RNA-binding protein C23E6.01c [Babesia sp. Xinjiang]|uniref:putative RNA-binding protein C23E6.01c n=1 Tax=Babesia sp. Xinjiang TaxID=462227 RepID=UPI000A22E649|nr:putative RNA-binding protein C23E6.01c [Babesia sp. Xinjiang]ORM39717.1 putative RNA-binding protein C23E6.01c [Babesia sp. Xinjiang]
MLNVAIDKYHCYIGCLHHTIGDEQLLTLAKCFSNHVRSCKVMRKPSTEAHLGYGFVQYTDAAYADEAIAKMQGIVVKGIPLYIRAAYPFTSTTLNEKNEEQANDVKNATVYVSELMPTATDNDLRGYAAPFGDVEYVSVIPNRRFGFVTFSKREYALGFICHMDGWKVEDTLLTCSWAYQSRTATLPGQFESSENEKQDAIFGQKYSYDLMPKKK